MNDSTKLDLDLRIKEFREKKAHRIEEIDALLESDRRYNESYRDIHKPRKANLNVNQWAFNKWI